jgi:hypothetical protein
MHREPGLGNVAKSLAHAPSLLLQDFAYTYRVWITLNKVLYAPLRHPKINPDIHLPE